ncbi:MAG: hypothetical protein ACRDOB_19125 [Streptosporangiaceae bacterium]
MNRMAERPMGSPSAPPRRPRNTEADELDALNVVLGMERENALSAKPSNPAEASIIKALEKSDVPLTPVEIARDGQLNFRTLSEGLLHLRQRGIITLGGSPGNEVVSLRSDPSGVLRISNVTLGNHLT